MSCHNCKNFAELKEPRKFDGYAIYGYCFKRSKTAWEQYPRGYPVYICDSGSCKDFRQDPAKPKPATILKGQISIDDVEGMMT